MKSETSRALILALAASFLLPGLSADAKRQEKVDKEKAAPVKAADKPEDPLCRECVGKAAGMFANGKVKEAADLLRSFRDRCPRNLQLHLLLSTALLRLGGFMDEAEESARQATEIAPSSVAAHMQYGIMLRANRKNTQAVPEFEAITRLDPTMYEAWSSLAELYNEIKEPEKAKAAAEKAANLDPQTVAARFRSLRRIAMTGKPEALRAEIKRMMSVDDQGAEYFDQLARESLSLGAFVEASEAAGKMLAAHPSAPSALKTRALAKLWLKDFRGSQAAAEDILKSNPDDAEALAVKAVDLASLGLIEESSRLMALAVEKDSRKPIVMFARGTVEYHKGELDRAIDSLSKALADDPKLGRAHVMLADAYLRRGRFEDALGEAREAGAASGFNAQAMALEARIRAVPKTPISNARTAVDLSERAMMLNARDPEVLITSSLIALADKRVADAKTKIAQVIAEEPGNVNAYIVLSEIAKAENVQPEPASVLTGEASNTPEVSYTLARVLEQLGDRSASLKAYQLSLNSGLTGADGAAAKQALSRLAGGSE